MQSAKGIFLKTHIYHFAIRTLQNTLFLHFFQKKFAYVKNFLYLCNVNLKKIKIVNHNLD